MAGETYTNSTGIKQSLLDAMKLVVKDKTWAIKNLKEGMKPKNRVHYFDVDDVAQPASNNAVVEGADATDGTPADFTQNVNYLQIVSKDYKISGTMEAVDYAGIKSQLVYQKKKALKKIGLDLEYAVWNGTGASGASGTAREMKGIVMWASANSGASSTIAATALGGTSGEEAVNDSLQALYDAGSAADTLVASSANKRRIDVWTANGATRYVQTENKTLTNTINVYYSTYGPVELVLSTYVGDNVYMFEKDAIRISYLRKPKSFPLAKSGDSHRFQVLTEATVEVRNPLGVAYCVTT